MLVADRQFQLLLVCRTAVNNPQGRGDFVESLCCATNGFQSFSNRISTMHEKQKTSD